MDVRKQQTYAHFNSTKICIHLILNLSNSQSCLLNVCVCVYLLLLSWFIKYVQQCIKHKSDSDCIFSYFYRDFTLWLSTYKKIFDEIHTRHTDRIGYCCSYPQQCSHTATTTLAGNIKTCVDSFNLSSSSSSFEIGKKSARESKKMWPNLSKHKNIFGYRKNGFLA